MDNQAYARMILLISILLLIPNAICAQEVPIISYSINSNGQAELEVSSTPQNYYILKVRTSINADYLYSTSITNGLAESTIISEPLGALPLENYQVLEYLIDAPADTDGDGVDDISEYENIPTYGPLNPAEPINPEDGIAVIDSFSTFSDLSITKDYVQWSEFLNGKGFSKFIIVDFNTSDPKIYFINGNNHELHADFANAVGIDFIGEQVIKGQIIYHPSIISNNGTLGAFTFNYSNGHGEDFEIVQRTHELLAANMPFIKNNLSYYITTNNEDEYEAEIARYENSRIPIIYEADAFAEIDYWGLNQTEGFGFFREMNLEDIPGARDIVLYNSLPNALPRVGGIITSEIQTPLSHINLRAIQDGIPNAFIRDPLSIDSIVNLLNHYIYFKVEQDDYIIREASIDEVNQWYDALRPKSEQTPPLNLEYTSILPLDEINFDMYDGYGAKCTNVAAMRTFGFPEGTIPNGFGVPFYYYQEFMKHNHLFEEVSEMLSNPNFFSDRNVRNNSLGALRVKIENAQMPTWMMINLAEMHTSFPAGTSVRCRSSTNNEDLPGFNGAGLYTSKTQHPDEGHIAKSIKQVYASLWNLRAFDEREFYRINHFAASMGVLCHPNYLDEKANGVGVSTDPIYQTEDAYFYLNSQLGEDLITNPDTTSIPEEILLSKVITGENDHIVVRHSNLVPNNEEIMKGEYLIQMREYLTVIHNEFQLLYNAAGNSTFAMDIEFKITSNDQLIVKQARPWVTYKPQGNLRNEIYKNTDFLVFPNPADASISLKCAYCNYTRFIITGITGQEIKQGEANLENGSTAVISIEDLAPGIYIITALSENQDSLFSRKVIKR